MQVFDIRRPDFDVNKIGSKLHQGFDGPISHSIEQDRFIRMLVRSCSNEIDKGAWKVDRVVVHIPGLLGFPVLIDVKAINGIPVEHARLPQASAHSRGWLQTGPSSRENFLQRRWAIPLHHRAPNRDGHARNRRRRRRWRDTAWQPCRADGLPSTSKRTEARDIARPNGSI